MDRAFQGRELAEERSRRIERSTGSNDTDTLQVSGFVQRGKSGQGGRPRIIETQIVNVDIYLHARTLPRLVSFTM